MSVPNRDHDVNCKGHHLPDDDNVLDFTGPDRAVTPEECWAMLDASNAAMEAMRDYITLAYSKCYLLVTQTPTGKIQPIILPIPRPGIHLL